ncbi:MAG: signal peptidase I [Bacteroidaceae bacterium]|nr:signal peptidase I [Bacteroidaceae bacterium]
MDKVKLDGVFGKVASWMIWATVIFVILVAISDGLRVFVADRFVIPSHSMEPTLREGDRILVSKIPFGARIYKNYDFHDGMNLDCFRTKGFGGIERNDVVVFNFPINEGRLSFKINYVYAKRCIGLPGDAVSIVDGFYKNDRFSGPLGELESQRLLQKTPMAQIDTFVRNVLQPSDLENQWTVKDFGPYYIPAKGDTLKINSKNRNLYSLLLEYEGCSRNDSVHVVKHDYFFMVGDNVLDSKDSRYWGLVPDDYIVGVVRRILFNKNPLTGKKSWRRARWLPRNQTETTLDAALKQAAENRSEIEKVLEHFKGDPLRHSAAQSLISGMLWKYSLDTSSTTQNTRFYKALSEYLGKNKFYGVSGLYDVSDSIESLHGRPICVPKYTKDLQTLGSEFLIRHIEKAVSAWKTSPWKEDVSFEIFCDHVLPYRVYNSWWEGAGDYLLKEYSDSLEIWKGLGLYEAAGRIESAVQSSFTIDGQFFRERPFLSPTFFGNTLEAKIGVCYDANSAVITLMRSMGIPADICTIPYWGNSNASHYWTQVVGEPVKGLYDNSQMDFRTEEDELVNNSFWFKGGTIEDTTGIPSEVQLRKNRTVPKIFRKTHSVDLNSLALQAGEEIPPFFRDPTLLDVTSSQVVTADVAVKVPLLHGHKRYAYLCCYEPGSFSWVPVSWSPIRKGKALFREMGVNVLYIAAIWKDGKAETFGAPFILTSDGEIRSVNSDKRNIEDVTLLSKVPFRTNFAYYALLCKGDRILTATKQDFSDTILVHSIDSIPWYEQDITLKKPLSARYLIYRTNSGLLKFLGDISAFDVNGARLTGKLSGNPGHTKYPLENAFDENRESYIYFDKSRGQADYVAMDFGKNEIVSSVRFCPRNDDNAIIPGDEYELFYWDKGWISLGKINAGKERKVHFKNVPKGALLRLQDNTRGQENRPFTIENGIQIWW